MENHFVIPKPKLEIAIDCLIGVLLALTPFGLDLTRIPQNSWFRLACFVASAIVLVRIFWILPGWFTVISVGEKGLIAFMFLASFAYFLWTTTVSRDAPTKTLEIEQVPRPLSQELP
jgi:hypothetical protein